MWDKIFDGFLTHLMHVGDFRLTFPDGTTRRYGDGSGDPIGVTLHDPTLPRKIIMSPDMAVGEAYMDERLTIENWIDGGGVLGGGHAGLSGGRGSAPGGSDPRDSNSVH